MLNKVVATAVILLITAGTAMAQNGKVPWRKDVDAAIAEAARTNRGMMLYFTSEG